MQNFKPHLIYGLYVGCPRSGHLAINSGTLKDTLQEGTYGYFAQYIKKLELPDLTLRNAGVFPEFHVSESLFPMLKMPPVLDF